MSRYTNTRRWGKVVRVTDVNRIFWDASRNVKERKARFNDEELKRLQIKSAPDPDRGDSSLISPLTGGLDLGTPCSDLNSESIFTPADMMLMSDEEDMLDLGDEDDDNDDLTLLKTPIWRQLSSVYEDADVRKMEIAEEELFYRRTSASSVEMRWKHVWAKYSGRYTLQEQCDDSWTDIYKGNLCRWEIVGMEQEKRHKFRVINDGDKIVTNIIEIILHKQSSVAEILGRAIASNDYAKIALICQSRPQPNINVPDASGMSPLMRACAMLRKDIVKTLLECGADVNFGNSANRTSAMLACLGGNLEVIETLVEHKANLRLRDRSGATCLHYAIDSGNEEVVQYLLKQRVDVDAQDNQGWTPLMCLAANRGTIDIAKTLIKAGSDVNYSDNIGKTVLMSASLAGNREMCELLVTNGAVHSAYTRFGKSAYEMAVAFDRKEVVEFFQKLKKRRNSVSLGVSGITF
ncbi:fibronectin type 3 and ankyrin repeat domains protein 1-like isoform X1 [Bolinopsis microptera]|uniref:fibronectin type 3 and ankyrin repeat domains protein 1-like isoform X1 n=1 Tax=Bolinopsis microptera TaxID=2820187 RepID=UPI00307987AA